MAPAPPEERRAMRVVNVGSAIIFNSILEVLNRPDSRETHAKSGKSRIRNPHNHIRIILCGAPLRRLRFFSGWTEPRAAASRRSRLSASLVPVSLFLSPASLPWLWVGRGCVGFLPTLRTPRQLSDPIAAFPENALTMPLLGEWRCHRGHVGAFRNSDAELRVELDDKSRRSRIGLGLRAKVSRLMRARVHVDPIPKFNHLYDYKFCGKGAFRYN